MEPSIGGVEAKSQRELCGVDCEGLHETAPKGRCDVHCIVTREYVGSVSVCYCRNRFVDREVEVYVSGRSVATDSQLEGRPSQVDGGGSENSAIALA